MNGKMYIFHLVSLVGNQASVMLDVLKLGYQAIQRCIDLILRGA